MRKLFIAAALTAACSMAAFGADAAAGKAPYDKACKSCHGADGAPNAGVAKMMKVEMRDLKSAQAQAPSDADLKKIITDGKGKMKPCPTVTGADVDNVVAFMRSLKK
jgi:mono/diheme cytochrome c family protein